MNKNYKSDALRPILGHAIGLGAALLVATLFSCLFAGILALGAPDALLSLFAHVTAICAGLAAGFFAGMKLKENGLINGLIAGAVVFGLHFLLTLLFGQVSLSCLTFLLAEGMAGTLGGIAAVNLRA